LSVICSRVTILFSCILIDSYLRTPGWAQINQQKHKRSRSYPHQLRTSRLQSRYDYSSLTAKRVNQLILQFSPTLINRLANPSSKSDDKSKPSSTDEIVRRRLAAESEHLRTQEAEILRDISSALEKENLDKEKPGMSSEVLGRDIEEVREKIERMKSDRLGQVGKGVQSAQEGVRKCYA